MRLHDVCPKCKSGVIRCLATKLRDQKRFRLRYLECDNPACGATGQELELLDERGRRKFAGKPLIVECPKCRCLINVTPRQDHDQI